MVLSAGKGVREQSWHSLAVSILCCLVSQGASSAILTDSGRTFRVQHTLCDGLPQAPSAVLLKCPSTRVPGYNQCCLPTVPYTVHV